MVLRTQIGPPTKPIELVIFFFYRGNEVFRTFFLSNKFFFFAWSWFSLQQNKWQTEEKKNRNCELFLMFSHGALRTFFPRVVHDTESSVLQLSVKVHIVFSCCDGDEKPQYVYISVYLSLLLRSIEHVLYLCIRALCLCYSFSCVCRQIHV